MHKDNNEMFKNADARSSTRRLRLKFEKQKE